MKFKTTVVALAAALSLGAATCMAATPTPSASPFDGFYLGGGITHSSITNKFDINFIQEAEFNGNMGFQTLGANLVAGYGKLINKMYLGGEIFYNWRPNHSGAAEVYNKTKNLPSIYDLKAEHTAGINVQAGYLITPRVVMYGMLGVSTTRFSYKIPTQKLTSTEMVPYASNRYAIVPGIGIKVACSEHFSIDAQYTYSIYKQINEDISPANHWRKADTNTMKPRIGTFTLSGIYHF